MNNIEKLKGLCDRFDVAVYIRDLFAVDGFGFFDNKEEGIFLLESNDENIEFSYEAAEKGYFRKNHFYYTNEFGEETFISFYKKEPILIN